MLYKLGPGLVYLNGPGRTGPMPKGNLLHAGIIFRRKIIVFEKQVMEHGRLF